MARKKAGQESGGGLPEWMATYSDLVTLLLTFFVLLFSMASVDVTKFEAVASSIRSSFNIMNMSSMMNKNTGDEVLSITDKVNAAEDSEEPMPEPGSKEYTEMLQGMVSELQVQVNELNDQIAAYQDAELENQEGAQDNLEGEQENQTSPTYELSDEEIIQKEIHDARQQKLNNFKQDILEEVDKLGIGGYVSIVDQEERLVLRLNSQILFDSGSATLRPEGRNVMIKLGESFHNLDHLVDVQGHTDNVPIRNAQFPSNWELSTQRATNVVRILQDECGVPPSLLRSTGFGEYQPIGDNTTPDGRQSNRRIDIVITAK